MHLRPVTRRLQMIRLAVWLGILILATTVSLRQPAPARFEPKATLGTWKWWMAPIEKNAVFRPTTTHAELRSIFFLPGQNQSGWAVGGNGTILHSKDFVGALKDMTEYGYKRTALPGRCGASSIICAWWRLQMVLMTRMRPPSERRHSSALPRWESVIRQKPRTQYMSTSNGVIPV